MSRHTGFIDRLRWRPRTAVGGGRQDDARVAGDRIGTSRRVAARRPRNVHARAIRNHRGKCAAAEGRFRRALIEGIRRGHGHRRGEGRAKVGRHRKLDCVRLVGRLEFPPGDVHRARRGIDRDRCALRHTARRRIGLAVIAGDEREVRQVDHTIAIRIGDGVVANHPAGLPVRRLDDVQIGVVDDTVVIEIGIGNRADVFRLAPRRAAVSRVAEKNLRFEGGTAPGQRGVDDVNAPARETLVDRRTVGLRNVERAGQCSITRNVDCAPLLVEEPNARIAVDEGRSDVRNGVAGFPVVEIEEGRHEDRALGVPRARLLFDFVDARCRDRAGSLFGVLPAALFSLFRVLRVFRLFPGPFVAARALALVVAVFLASFRLLQIALVDAGVERRRAGSRGAIERNARVEQQAVRACSNERVGGGGVGLER